MKPLKLTIQAFGPYAGCEVVDFESIDHGLFLVCGPTGSGKTSIFDAIKYALYGVTSDDSRSAREMRSAHASPDTPTYIELVFEHAGCEYRIVRAPAQLRPKLRGSGMREAPPEASLEDVTNGVSLASRDSDVTAHVSELLGVDADQFGRIVMIAQNDFAKVLNAKTREREALFRKLFGTALYARAQDALDERRRGLETAISSQRSLIDTEIGHILPPVNETLLESFQNLVSDESRSYRPARVIRLLDACIESEGSLIEDANLKVASIRESISKLDTELGRIEMLDQARERKDKAMKWIEDHANALAEAVSMRDDLEALEPQRDELRTQISKLSSTLPEYDKLNAYSKDLMSAEKALAVHGESLAKLQEGLAVAEGELASLVEEQARLADADIRLARVEAAKQQARVDREQLESVIQHANAHASASKSLRDKQRQLLEAEDVLFRANSLFAEAQRLYNADRSGMLAEALKQGESCPVCGSTEHPRLAQRSGDAPSDAELEKLERDLDLARDARDELAQQAASARALEETTQSSLREAAARLFGSEVEKLQNVLALRKEELDCLDAKLEAEERTSKEDKKRLEELSGLVEAKTREQSDMRSQSHSLHGKTAELERTYAQAQANYETRKSGLAFPDKSSAQKEIASLQESLDAQQAALSLARESVEKALSKRAEQLAVIQAAEETLSSSDDVLDEGLREQRESLAVQESELSKSVTSANTALVNHRTCKSSIERLEVELEELEGEFKSVDLVARLASGKTAGHLGKVAFETYVQGAYFDRVLAAANERLQIMSASRYSLARRETGADRRAVAGLEIDVLDRYTGSMRPAQTLSGGETFLASISLALGLSDVIMAQAGGMHIDAMFVDEGFGTLDEETCQLAIEVLGSLSSDARMIGIISHVDELKERIGTQIRVTKTREGSTLELVSE